MALPFDPRLMMGMAGSSPIPGEWNVSPRPLVNSLVDQLVNWRPLTNMQNNLMPQMQALNDRLGMGWVPGDIAQAFNYAQKPAAAAAPRTAQRPAATPAALPAPVATPQNIFAFARVPGDKETSGFRDPDRNKRVGGVSNSFHTRRDEAGNAMATDRVPPRGMSMSAFHSELRRLNPHLDVINEGDHVHMEPRTGSKTGPQATAFANAAQAAGLGAPPPAINWAGHQQADRLLAGITEDAMKPFSAQYTPQELPALPTPQMAQAPDYTKSDTAFEAAKPQNPFGDTPEEQERGQLKMRRASYFAGIGQALASYQDGQGLGSLFARMGGAALQGAALGDEKVQAKLDQFDKAMQGYNLALANREEGKAEKFAQVANQNIASMNQYAKEQWSVQVKEIERFQPRMENGVLITFDKDPASGQVKETHTPMDPSRRAASTYQRANLAMSMGNMANEYNQMTWRHSQALAGAMLPYAMADEAAKGNFDGRNGILGVGLYDAGNALVETGRWRELADRVDPQVAAQMETDAYAAAGIQMGKGGRPIIPPSAEQLGKVNDYILSAFIPWMVNTKHANWLIGGPTQTHQGGKASATFQANPDPVTSSAVQAFRTRDRRLTARTDTKGRVTTTESYDNR